MSNRKEKHVRLAASHLVMALTGKKAHELTEAEIAAMVARLRQLEAK